MTVTTADWTVLVPVKATTRGKSRLDLPANQRQAMALAMALDTVSAAAVCVQVLVVLEDDGDLAELGAVAGVRVHRTVVKGLNESILDGLSALPDAGPVAVLPADLPGLLPDDLRAALALAARHRFSVVADHQGAGTTLLAATTRTDLRPRYGPNSLRRHVALGAQPLALAVDSSLRFDVDVLTDTLAGVGPRTRLALASVEPCRSGR